MRLADGCTWDTRHHFPVDVIERGEGPHELPWDIGNPVVYPPVHGPVIETSAACAELEER